MNGLQSAIVCGIRVGAAHRRREVRRGAAARRPPSQRPGAVTRVITFDFGAVWPGITISAPTVTMVVDPSSMVPDGSPASRLLGSASVVASPSTGAANQAVQQLVGNFTGAVYRLGCYANGSDGSTPELWQTIGTC